MNTLCLFGVSDSVVSNVYCSEGRKEAGPPCEWVLAVAGRSGSCPLLQRCALIFSSHRRIGTGYHAACVSNLNKTQPEPIVIFEFFAMCTFPWTRNEFVKTYALNNIHFWSGHTVFDVLFVFSRFHVFFDPRKGPNHEKRNHVECPFIEWGLQNSQRPIPSQNMGLQVHDTSVNTAMSV